MRQRREDYVLLILCFADATKIRVRMLTECHKISRGDLARF